MNAPPPESLARYWQPRYWPVWLGFGLLRLLVPLPYPLQRAAGRGLGALLRLALPRRRRIAAANLRLCFPELDDAARDALLRRHFASLGLQFIEIGLTGWASDARVRRLTRIEGLDHLRRATAGGKGAILLSGHFAPVEFGGRRLGLEGEAVGAMYRPNKNRLVDALLRRGRGRAVRELISKDSMRQLVRALSRGISVWYAPDQSYRRRHAVLVPFMGEPAMTNAALTQIVRLAGAPVVPLIVHRLADGSGYQLTIEPALEDFPGPDPEADARRINDILGRWVREAPEEYYWIHRRFKGRPEGFADPYSG